MANSPIPAFTDTSSSAAAPQRVLPPTSAKTPAGSPQKPSGGKAKPSVGSKPGAPQRASQKPTGASSDPYGIRSLVAAQVQPALQDINAQEAQQLAAQNQQRGAIQQATNQFLQYLQGQPSVSSDYQHAAQTEGALGSAGAAFLQGQNPTASLQSLVAASSPQQAAEIASRLGAAYGQGAAALYAQQGLIPGSTLAENGAAAGAFQKSQLPNVALQGIQNLKQFDYGSNQADQALAQKRADIYSQIPGLTAKAQAAAAQLAATNNYRNATLGLRQSELNSTNAYRQGELGLRNSELNSTNAYRNAEIGLANNRLGLEGTRINNQTAEFTAREKRQQEQFIARQTQQAREFNARQTTAANKLALPSPSLSQKVGYLVDSSGRPILNAKGGRQILPNFKTQNGVVVPRTKAGSGTNGGKAFTQSDALHFVKSITKTSYNSQGSSNSAGGRTTSSTVSGHSMPYLQAYKYLRSKGMGDVDARTVLDTTYARGQDGRAWVTNEEQAVLRKAGAIGIRKSPTGSGYLTARQYNILQKAGKLPPGHQGSDPSGAPIWWING